MAKKYLRVQNTDRVRSAIELIQNYLGYRPDADSETAEWAIRYALDMVCADKIEGYNIFTGKVEKGDNNGD